jgi:4-hydroxy-3-methylbut-2-enyl diphosphate reductase
MNVEIEIDQKSGFCFGVVNAIKAVEENIRKYPEFFCLGDIVHNEIEINRLNDLGLKVIHADEIDNIENAHILIRAHGEPPITYERLQQKGNHIIDATCPIVLKLQQRIKKSWEELKDNKGQIVIYGKKGHPEVVGLKGQTDNEAIIISDESDLSMIDFHNPVRLYSQTTKSRETYAQLANKIQSEMKALGQEDFIKYNTICGQVANRVPHLREYAPKFDVFIFVSGENSSNGKYLYNIVREVNKNAYFISRKGDIKKEWFEEGQTIGVSGATSTPSWLLEEVASHIKAL